MEWTIVARLEAGHVLLYFCLVQINLERIPQRHDIDQPFPLQLPQRFEMLQTTLAQAEHRHFY